MVVPVGLNIYSGLVGATMPYLDATSAPFESLWFPDHVQYANRNVAEGWSLFVYALARYPDKLGGHQVLCNSFRNPAHLAKMAATCQTLSGGRVVLGIGAGWNEEEYLAYGWPFPSARMRIEQLAEAIQICRAMWGDKPATFHGKHYTIDNAYCEPKPDPLPPVMVGGAGERFLLPRCRRTCRLVELHLPDARSLCPQASGAATALPRRWSRLRFHCPGRRPANPDR